MNIGDLVQPPHQLRILRFLRPQLSINICQAGYLRHRRKDCQAGERQRGNET